MKQYLNLMRKIRDEGFDRGDRTGTGTRSLFGPQLRFDLELGFPLVTTKRVHLKSVIHELLWFIAGDTNIKYLNENDVTIWDEWADAKGDLGPVYGAQWRAWPDPFANPPFEVIDQLQRAIDTLQIDPNSRRIIVSAWNVADLRRMALAPCHLLFQFYSRPMTVYEMVVQTNSRGEYEIDYDSVVDEDFHKVQEILAMQGLPSRYLSLQLYQRSADYFLGVPFNIASYAILLHMVADLTGHQPKEFVHTFGDCHLYSNHMEQVEEQLSRKPRHLPVLELHRRRKIDEYVFDDVAVIDYDPYPVIKAPIAV